MTQEKLLLVVSVLFGVSEALSLIPFINANGVFQAVFSVLKKLAGK